MSMITDLFTPKSIDVPSVIPATKPPKEEDEAIQKTRQDFLAKQALLTQKNSTIKTSALGITGDVLQTAKKSLLGA